jgi:hypothetical protein
MAVKLGLQRVQNYSAVMRRLQGEFPTVSDVENLEQFVLERKNKWGNITGPKGEDDL